MAETGTIRTRTQRWAEKAFQAVSERRNYPKKNDYVTFAKSFPALIHTCGLVQALAFAEAKAKDKGAGRSETRALVEDLARVLGVEPTELLEQSRKADVVAYLRLSRNALAAAGWLKRYAEALLDDTTKEAG